jgi:hypothetical protein
MRIQDEMRRKTMIVEIWEWAATANITMDGKNREKYDIDDIR